jgi:uncharacterized GH25 family protein
LNNKKKSSGRLFGWTIGAVIVLFLFFMRSDIAKLGENALRSISAWPSDSENAVSGNKSGIGSLLWGSGKAAPFEGGTGVINEEPIPVALTGKVLSEPERAPIAGAKVHMLALSSPSETIEKTTDDNGEFKIDAPAAFRYELNVEAKGFNSYKNEALMITRPDYRMEIVLAPTRFIKGQVLDLQSQGVPYAIVGLYGEDGSGPLMSQTTDDQGVFSVPFYMRGGGTVQLDAFHAGYDSQGAVAVKLPVEDDVIIRMAPAPGTGSLVGLVRDSEEMPVEGAKITVMDAATRRTLSEVVTDENGEYRLSRIREGSFPVRCAADGFAQTGYYQSAVTINAGKEARLDFTLRSGQQITGVVVNQKGDPVANATVMYSLASMTQGMDRGSNNSTRSRNNRGNSTSDQRNRGAGSTQGFGSRGGNMGGMPGFGSGGGNMGGMPGFGSRGGNMGGMPGFGSGGGNMGGMQGFGSGGGNMGGMQGFGSRGGNMGGMQGFGSRGGNMGGMQGFGGGNMSDMGGMFGGRGGMGGMSGFGSSGGMMGGMQGFSSSQNFMAPSGSTTTDQKGRFRIVGLTADPYQINVQHRDYAELSTQLQPSKETRTLVLDGGLILRGTASNIQGVPIDDFSLMFQSSASSTRRFSRNYSFTSSDGYFEVRGLTPDKYTLILREGRDRYSGTLELQTSMQVLLLAGKTAESQTDAQNALAEDPNQRVRGRRGRGSFGDMAALTIVAR